MSERGSVSTFAVAIALVLATAITVGLRARTTDAGFQKRALERTCARWAAEAGISRALNRVRTGRKSSFNGVLPSDGRYEVTVRTQGKETFISSKGECNKDARWTIELSREGEQTRRYEEHGR